MNSYLISLTTGASQEVEADLYLGDGGHYIFMAGDLEVMRVLALEVVSITKAR